MLSGTVILLEYGTRSCHKCRRRKRHNEQLYDCQRGVENVWNISLVGDIKRIFPFASYFPLI